MTAFLWVFLLRAFVAVVPAWSSEAKALLYRADLRRLLQPRCRVPLQILVPQYLLGAMPEVVTVLNSLPATSVRGRAAVLTR